MIEQVDWDSVISATAGGAAAVATFKAFLSKSLREIEQNTEKLQESQMALHALSTKLETFEKIPGILHEHDRKIAKIEARLDHDTTRVRKVTNREN